MYMNICIYIYICVHNIFYYSKSCIYIYIQIYEYIDSGINNKIDMKENIIYLYIYILA